MGTSLLIPLFFQLLAIVAHGRTLSDNSLSAFRETDNLEMPTTSRSPPKYPAGSRDMTPNRLIMMSINTQVGKPLRPPPPTPVAPPGPHESPKPPNSPAECLSSCCWLMNSITTTATSLCCGKSSSSSTSETEWITQRPPSVRPPPPPPLIQNIATG